MSRVAVTRKVCNCCSVVAMCAAARDADYAAVCVAVCAAVCVTGWASDTLRVAATRDALRVAATRRDGG